MSIGLSGSRDGSPRGARSPRAGLAAKVNARGARTESRVAVHTTPASASKALFDLKQVNQSLKGLGLLAGLGCGEQEGRAHEADCKCREDLHSDVWFVIKVFFGCGRSTVVFASS